MKTGPSWRFYNPGVEEKAMIQIDDAGWGSLLSGVIIASLRKETGEFAWREVPVEQFQGNNFEGRVYLMGAPAIAWLGIGEFELEKASRKGERKMEKKVLNPKGVHPPAGAYSHIV